MKTLWLLYEDGDYALNRSYGHMMQERGKRHGLDVQPVMLSELTLGMDAQGIPHCLRNGAPALPCAVLSRQRSSLISEHFERIGIAVYNDSFVCAICNDKRATHQFLQGLPMPRTVFLLPGQNQPPTGTHYPVILKPACSHGGDRVMLVENEQQWREAAARILSEPALQQEVVSDAGKDLRVYVVNGHILAGVMRTAKSGVVSNFKQGGAVALHELTAEERQLAQSVINRFEQAGSRLYMAGVDLLYDQGRPVVGEVEDVVGSRMLYQVSDIDIADLYLKAIAELVANGP